MALPTTITLKEKYALFSDQWSPKIVAELNGQHVKIAKVSGEFVWHHHAQEDELFMVLEGTLFLDFKEGTQSIGPGQLLVVPAGVEHKPYTRNGEEVHILMIEPKSTLNTGNVTNDKTQESLPWI
ncbi:MAG TPA: cupin domain-containing protein [Cytophagales bacterium]|nr:cupin domain-containing protein [Cytophagales bacterium]HAA19696.1 cupin domain-containing protein [Cytophagales bacterium]HAP61643.1 cupin domain-containing protein [Cytophagales bacterium]